MKISQHLLLLSCLIFNITIIMASDNTIKIIKTDSPKQKNIFYMILEELHKKMRKSPQSNIEKKIIDTDASKENIKPDISTQDALEKQSNDTEYDFNDDEKKLQNLSIRSLTKEDPSIKTAALAIIATQEFQNYKKMSSNDNSEEK